MNRFEFATLWVCVGIGLNLLHAVRSAAAERDLAQDEIPVGAGSHAGLDRFLDSWFPA